MVSSSLFEGNREIFLNSAVYKSLVEKMQEAPDLTHTMPSRLNFAHGQEGEPAHGPPRRRRRRNLQDTCFQICG